MHASLRPLGIGEILDRAVTLSVRYFVPLALIWAVYLLPSLVLSYFGGGDTAKVFGALIDAVGKGTSADPNAVAKQMAAAQRAPGVWLSVYVIFALVTYPLGSAALLRSVSAIYLGGPSVGFRDAYRSALRQWPQMLGLTAIWIGFGVLAYLGFVLVGVIVGLTFALLIYVTKAFGIVVAVIAGVAVTAAVLVAVAVAVVAFYVSYVTQIVENAGFVRSFSIALTRVVGRTLRRSLLFGLALGAVNVGLAVVGLGGYAVSFGVLRSNVLGLAVSALLGIVNAVFLAAMVTIYYYDTRVRTEGLDLQLEAQADAAGALV